MSFQLIAAPHTPMKADGELNLEMVARQGGHFRETGVTGVFIAGSTGEGLSLGVEEREELAAEWARVAGVEGLKLFVQVGSTCQRDAVRLAAHAVSVGADAVATLAPCYYKPETVGDLVAFCEPIAGAAGGLPFYFYDIPDMSGVSLPMVEFLKVGAAPMANLAGIKYTNPDLAGLQECLRLEDGRFELLYGNDESLVAGYALGVHGAVGSTYNFAALLYRRLLQELENGDEVEARRLQADSVRMVRVIGSYGYLPAAKAVMGMLGIDCGPARAPLRNLTNEEKSALRWELEALSVIEFRTSTAL
ncbi:MAG: dihydrodipicolinate synthase family protein [Verrucomicrobiota bacterium]